jgi:hypothetical protein
LIRHLFTATREMHKKGKDAGMERDSMPTFGFSRCYATLIRLRG